MKKSVQFHRVLLTVDCVTNDEMQMLIDEESQTLYFINYEKLISRSLHEVRYMWALDLGVAFGGFGAAGGVLSGSGSGSSGGGGVGARPAWKGIAFPKKVCSVGKHETIEQAMARVAG